MRECKSWKEGPNKKRNGEKVKEIKTKITVRKKERKNWNREKVWRNERERKGRKCHDKLTGRESEQKNTGNEKKQNKEGENERERSYEKEIEADRVKREYDRKGVHSWKEGVKEKVN